MYKKAISLAIAMAFAMNVAASADEHGHHFHKQQVQQLSARLHVLPSCTLYKDEDHGQRADLNFRELDATGTDASDAYSPNNSSLKYVCSKWTHPRLTLSDGKRGGEGGHEQTAFTRGGRNHDSKNFYLVNGDDKIAYNISTGGFEFDNDRNPNGDGALALASNSEGHIKLNAKLAHFRGPLVPGHYSDVVTATLFF